MPRIALLLVPAALLAGCGGGSDSSSAPSAPSKPRTSAPAPGNGQLRVGATDIGIGDASTGTASGSRTLPSKPFNGKSHTEEGVGAGADCADKDVTPTAENLSTVVTATLCLLNGERSDAGLSALTQNARLASAAAAHTQEMIAKQYFDHVGKDGTDPVDRIRTAGYIPTTGAWTVGENLAWGTGSLATPKEIVQAWMKSTGHRENILRPTFKEIGFGVAVGNPRSDNGSGATFTTTFGGITGAATSTSTAKAKKRKKARRARRARTAKAKASKAAPKKSTRPSGSH